MCDTETCLLCVTLGCYTAIADLKATLEIRIQLGVLIEVNGSKSYKMDMASQPYVFDGLMDMITAVCWGKPTKTRYMRE